MQVSREQAVLLFNELGIMTANKWNSARTAAKLNKLDEMVDRDTRVCDEATPILKAVMAAIKAEENIEVSAVAQIAKVLVEPKLPDPVKKVEKSKTEKATTTATPTQTSEKLGGVRKNCSRLFFAGAVVKSTGIETVFTNGITQEMVDEVDRLYGKVNPSESFFALRTAHHVVRGYTEGAE